MKKRVSRLICNLWISFIIAFTIFSLIFIPQSQAENKFALIIGNSKYEVGELNNPVKDATKMHATLRELGFESKLETNTTKERMEGAIEDFGKNLHTDSVGLFYYSGHGIQYEGNNYLIPIDMKNAKLDSLKIKYDTYPANRVLDIMNNSGCHLKIMILDACRTNPFPVGQKTVLKKGLASMPVTGGTLIAYATSPGEVAYDGDKDEGNSPYTRNILKFIKAPDLPIEFMLKEVHKAVKGETEGKQLPWYEVSIDGDFSFNKTTEENLYYIVSAEFLVQRLAP